MSSVAERLRAVQARVDEACRRAGRAVGSAQLLAVSKLQPSAAIEEAHRAGHRDFGENYPQELRDKATELGALTDLRWHAIGPLQINKVKYVARSAYAFHALDRLELAQELSRRREGPALKCFLEVNVGEEASKSGVPENGAQALLDQVRALPQLNVVGLMCLPPLCSSPESARPYFERLAGLAEKLGLTELSMGTTSDYEVAIACGATVVRVGTAIFGERPGH